MDKIKMEFQKFIGYVGRASLITFLIMGFACKMKVNTPNGSSDSLSSEASPSPSPSVAPLDRLVWVQQPSNAAVGSVIAPAIKLKIVDADGNLTNSTATVSLAILNNPGNATLGGTTSVNAVAGIVTFSGITINQGGLGYTLQANSTSLQMSEASSSFNVNATGTNLVTNTGAGTFTVPAGVTSLTVEAWGAGGGGAGQDSGKDASSGGNYAKSIIAVTPGQTIYYMVGAGGIGVKTLASNPGGPSWVNSAANSAPSANTTGVYALGGSGSNVGSPNNSSQSTGNIGQTIYIGGAGGAGAEGGGGAAASSFGNGGNGNNGSGGAGGASPGAGAGGSGSTSQNGADGTSHVEGGGGGGGAYNHRGGQGGVPGGGGGGGYSTNSVAPTVGVNTNPHGNGGDGGRGQVRISY